MSIDIAGLRRLAIAAVDGPWSFRPSIPEEGFEGFWIESGVQHITTMDGPQSEERTANAAYIAAANPTALLSLLDELEGLRNALTDAAESLNTIATLAGKEECLQEMTEVRSYARSRHQVAAAAIHAAEGKGDE